MCEKLTLQQKIGQRVIIGFEGTQVNETLRQVVQKYKVGNIILFAHNIVDKLQLRKLCEDVQQLIINETGYPALIAIDQEGGVVVRMPEDATHIPGAMAVAATGKPYYAYRAGVIAGRELKAVGVNFNLAPDMDINSNAQNPVIGTRSYGDTAETVITYGLEMLKGLAHEGLLAAAKHFPGHGDTAVDSHVGLPQVDKTLEDLGAVELRSFQAAIAAGVPAIMTSHILFPQIEQQQLPATMSRTLITEVLKKQMGFCGLVVSDCMEMNAIKQHYGTVEGCVMAMQAGVDLVCISHTTPLVEAVSESVSIALEKGTIDPKEMDAAVEKILMYKERYVLQPQDTLQSVGCEAHRHEMYQVTQEALTWVNKGVDGQLKLGEFPLFLGCQPYRFTQASSHVDQRISFSRYMAQHLGGEGIDTPVDPSPQEIAYLLEQIQSNRYTALVMATYNGHLNRGQLALATALCKMGRPTLVIALRNPYDLKEVPQEAFTLAAYEYTWESLRAIKEELTGMGHGTGQLRVKF